MKIEPRAYQKAIYSSITQQGNTLVVLPTGLGKTLIGFMLIETKLKTGKCLFLAPTRPLVKQHYASFLEISETEPNIVTTITGEIPKNKRKIFYEKQIIFSTPQTIKNDLLSGILKNPEAFSLCIFDEAHRAIGDYAYTLIAERVKDNACIVGLTASPGGNRARINEILANLFIQNVQIRAKTDEDVQNYVKNINIKWIETQLTPDLKLIKSILGDLISNYVQKLRVMGFQPQIKSKKLFIALRQKILNIRSNAKYTILVTYSILLNLLHMQELTETQGISSLRNYLEKTAIKKTKSAAILLKNPEIIRINQILLKTKEEHPKLFLLIDLIKQMEGKKIIVFAQYRHQVALIEQALRNANIQANIFLGKKGKYTKKQQEETIAQFREDKFRVLVASSIGEEGLDIPAVDAVIFYEPIPSEIRSIQRRGRAGRFKEGQVYILITRGTRDEYFHWASINREKRMKHIIKNIQRSNTQHSKSNNVQLKMKIDKNGQSKLNSFF
ncbi:MAG: DEAD/DEAH box helicase family protein [Candidatus Micrarchaeota archaeon]